jgi:thymidine kinase
MAEKVEKLNAICVFCGRDAGACFLFSVQTYALAMAIKVPYVGV